MKSAEQTKQHVLRQAIQHNVDGVHGIKPKTPDHPKRALGFWLWSFLLLASLAYILAPTHVVSRGTISSSTMTAKLERSDAPPASGVPIPDAEPELLPPRPLNRAVVPLSIKNIVIDAGHGGWQTGAISESGLLEKDVTLDIARRLRRLMSGGPFNLMMTRQKDRAVSLAKRVAFANSNRADLFVSIHVNWLEPHSLRALETFYVGPSDDPAVMKLASLENQDSGYSLADYRRILEKVYIDTKRDESHRLARSIHAELFRTLSRINPALENRGVKTAPFAVLIGTQMPAILAEVSCLSNEDEVKLLTSEDYREKIATAIQRGIRSYTKDFITYARKGS
jgi:N-acetylmuramoyl-L-alanine amidase